MARNARCHEPCSHALAYLRLFDKLYVKIFTFKDKMKHTVNTATIMMVYTWIAEILLRKTGPEDKALKAALNQQAKQTVAPSTSTETKIKEKKPDGFFAKVGWTGKGVFGLSGTLNLPRDIDQGFFYVVTTYVFYMDAPQTFQDALWNMALVVCYEIGPEISKDAVEAKFMEWCVHMQNIIDGFRGYLIKEENGDSVMVEGEDTKRAVNEKRRRAGEKLGMTLKKEVREDVLDFILESVPEEKPLDTFDGDKEKLLKNLSEWRDDHSPSTTLFLWKTAVNNNKPLTYTTGAVSGASFSNFVDGVLNVVEMQGMEGTQMGCLIRIFENVLAEKDTASEAVAEIQRVWPGLKRAYRGLGDCPSYVVEGPTPPPSPVPDDRTGKDKENADELVSIPGSSSEDEDIFEPPKDETPEVKKPEKESEKNKKQAEKGGKNKADEKPDKEVKKTLKRKAPTAAKSEAPPGMTIEEIRTLVEKHMPESVKAEDMSKSLKSTLPKLLAAKEVRQRIESTGNEVKEASVLIDAELGLLTSVTSKDKRGVVRDMLIILVYFWAGWSYMNLSKFISPLENKKKRVNGKLLVAHQFPFPDNKKYRDSLARQLHHAILNSLNTVLRENAVPELKKCPFPKASKATAVEEPVVDGDDEEMPEIGEKGTNDEGDDDDDDDSDASDGEEGPAEKKKSKKVSGGADEAADEDSACREFVNTCVMGLDAADASHKKAFPLPLTLTEKKTILCKVWAEFPVTVQVFLAENNNTANCVGAIKKNIDLATWKRLLGNKATTKDWLQWKIQGQERLDAAERRKKASAND